MPKRTFWIVVAGGAALLALGVWLVASQLPSWLNSPGPTETTTPSATPAAGARRIAATLFYVSEDGRELVPVIREVLYGSTPAEQARNLIAAQLEKPPSNLLSTIPEGTEVKRVYLSPNGEAYVDLSPEIVKGHLGGVLNEALTVYALVNVVTTNLADVTAVQILVGGTEVDSLTGHLDLRHPLPKSLEWVRKGQ
jgi:spore germination protein GerM